MICAPCKNKRHDECIAEGRDKTWCDCHHRTQKEEK